MRARVRTRLVTLVGFVIAVTIIAVTGQTLHLHYQMPVVRQKLPAKLSSYLGVYEPGSPAGLPPGGGVQRDGRPPAEPGRVLQRLGRAVQHLFRRPDAQARRHPVRADRSPVRLDVRDRRTAPTTITCAPMPTACGVSAIPWSSGSGTR